MKIVLDNAAQKVYSGPTMVEFILGFFAVAVLVFWFWYLIDLGDYRNRRVK
jgi:hypothetical protein